MPFGTITAATKSYEPRTPGTYILSTVVAGQPTNEFRLRGASITKDGLLRCSLTRVLEKDVLVGGSSVRKQGIISLSVTIPAADYTATDVDSLIADISEFATATTISRMLQGES